MIKYKKLMLCIFLLILLGCSSNINEEEDNLKRTDIFKKIDDNLVKDTDAEDELKGSNNLKYVEEVYTGDKCAYTFVVLKENKDDITAMTIYNEFGSSISGIGENSDESSCVQKGKSIFSDILEIKDKKIKDLKIGKSKKIKFKNSFYIISVEETNIQLKKVK